MIPYKKFGQVAERPHLNLPKDTYEEEYGLDGFFGQVSHLYHRHPPTSWKLIERSSLQPVVASIAEQSFLKPYCFKPFHSLAGGDLVSGQRKLFWNEDIIVSWVHLNKESTFYFRNSDAHELYFCHRGLGILDSAFGSLSFSAGDYLLLPRGLTYRFETKDAFFLKIENLKEAYRKPSGGILGQQALYHEENMRPPSFDRQLILENSSEILVQRNGQLTSIHYPFDIRDIAGWCGNLYPWALSVHSIAPVLSSMAHLPPSVNSTFVTSQFIVCTFLPRPLEEPAGALKVPFFHSNIDYDEVIFYHAGDFFSRDHMEQGSITLHPRGIHHGPHPKALLKQHEMKRTNEIAVMIDTIKPLMISQTAGANEIQEYWKSWSPR